jgi:vancomycin permeability regulator SanA
VQSSTPETTPPSKLSDLVFAARTLAVWLGAFALLSAVVALRHPAFNENLWWVDLRALGSAADAALVVVGVLFVWFGWRPAAGGWRRISTSALAFGLTLAALVNTAMFYVEWHKGTIRPTTFVPFSFLMALLLAGLGSACLQASSSVSRARRFRLCLSVSLLFVLGLPLAQLGFFGTTDYRRPADVIVVLGAKVHANGAPSTTLRDRVSTAAELYREGLAPTLIVSGGIGETGFDESEVMRDLAVSYGVPASAIVLDHEGITSNATVTNTTRLFRERGHYRALVVSQFYHLPRLQLDYQRAGYDVYTVPAAETIPIPKTPWFVIREIPAFWLYYVRGAFS